MNPFWIERGVVVAEIEQVGDQVFIHFGQGQRRADNPEGRDDLRQTGARWRRRFLMIDGNENY